MDTRKECDLVMKGGITSGVIYPRLIAALSDTYTFRSIGGTSAGAIAAAAAAAAQLGVNSRANPNAFKHLEQLPIELGKRVPGGKDSKLFKLFQPHQRLKRHFALLTAALNAPSKKAIARRVAVAAAIRFPLGALTGALPGVIVLTQVPDAGGIGRLLLIGVGFLLTLLGLIVGALLAALRSFGRRLPANSFGLCNGMPTAAGQGPDALTPWLHGYLNRLAGKTGGAPLTFGELKAANVELAMMTTALNLGRPYRIPFETGDIYYVEDELKAFFPTEVMQWLKTHARLSNTAATLSRSEGRTFHALPAPENFPVLVGVRLSLSFPILLSAMPLYTIDRTLAVNSGPPQKATRVYFSDGGISSNFPVHFFDSPLPSRPTFGVNLKPFHPDHPADRVFLPKMLRNNTGIKNYCPPLSDAPGFGSVFGFLGAIVSTMQSWRDQIQLAMPGFRDRIVHISHSEEEGGLNLNMPAKVIEELAKGGGLAAGELVKAFAIGGRPGDPNAWDNHRRIRIRALLSALQQQINAIAKALALQQSPPYPAVLVDNNPPSYPFARVGNAQEALTLLTQLEQLAQSLQQKSVDLAHGAPRPVAEIRIVPRV